MRGDAVTAIRRAMVGEVTTSGTRSTAAAGLRRAAGFATLHAVLITAAAAASIVLRDVAVNQRVAVMLAIFAAGSWIGGFLALLIATAIAGRRPPLKRFAAMLATLTTGTAGGIALVYLFEFRLLDAEFWSDGLTPHIFVELLFTGASAGYTLLVSGLPLLLPHGLLVLFGAAIWFARLPRG
jgi:hypothetical protein